MTSLADVNAGIVHASIDIEAPAEDVFDAFTTPEQLAAWWGGGMYRTFDWEFEARAGAAWRVRTEGPGGSNSVHGDVIDVERPWRLVYTWHASWDGFARTVIELRLAPIASGTRVSVIHRGFEGRAEACNGHAEGWALVLGWWAAHVRAA